MLDKTRSRVLLALCVIPMRVAESRNRYSPVGSRSARVNRKHNRACSIEPAHSRYSAPGHVQPVARCETAREQARRKPGLAVAARE